ncbi:MAG: heavy-metal-associated domain-containing protein [bacterium]
MKTKVVIQNLQCPFCQNAVIKRMLKIEGVSNIHVDLENSEVAFEYTTHNVLEGLRENLSELGYPITTDPNTIQQTS